MNDWRQMYEELWQMVVDAYDNDACVQAWMPDPRLDMAKAIAALLGRADMRPLSMYCTDVSGAALRRAAREGRLKAEKVGNAWFATESAVRDYLAHARTRNGRGNGRG